MTAAEEAEFWIRWKRGESVPAIGRALGRQRTTLAGSVAGHGGIPPPVRRRAARVLSTADREDILRGLAAQTPYRVIAQRWGRAPSAETLPVGHLRGVAPGRSAPVRGRLVTKV